MKLLDSIFGFVGRAPENAPAETTSARVTEAVGVTIDGDDDEWRRLSGDTQRDLSPTSQ